MFKLVINISQTEDQNLLNVDQTEVYNFKAKMNLDQNMNVHFTNLSHPISSELNYLTF